MSARPRRSCGQVSYVEPTELDDDIATCDPHFADSDAAESSHPNITDDDHDDDAPSSDSDSDSGSDVEYTTDKKVLRAQQKKKLAKKIKRPKKVRDVPFPFMDLPAEIRVIIYNLTLVESITDLCYVSRMGKRQVFRGTMRKKLHPWGHSEWLVQADKIGRNRARTPLQPALLRVNRAIYNEALPYLYGQKLHFGSPTAFQLWLGRVTPSNRMLLNDIVIRGWVDLGHGGGWIKDIATVFSLLTTTPNIKSILLDRQVHSDTDDGTYRNGETKHDGPGFWHDIEFWAHAVDAAHGKGSAKHVLKFTKVCFGSKQQIENENKAVAKRERDFMRHLKFSDKPAASE